MLCDVVRFEFMPCSVMVSGLVLMFFMHLVLLNVYCFLSLGCVLFV